jgi:cell division septum initiation protein DivIVA
MSDEFSWLEPLRESNSKLEEELEQSKEQLNKLKSADFNITIGELSKEDIGQLKENKRYLAAQAKQKLKRLKAKEQADKILQRTIFYTLRPKSGDRQRVIAEAFRELINQCGYDNFNLDGDHGMLVINVRDVLGIIEVLENE